jgi:hypothetical protein
MRVSTFCEEVDLRESYFLTKFSPSSVTGEFAPLLLSGRLANIDGGGQIAGDSTRGRLRFTCEDDLSKCLFEQLPLLVVVTLGRRPRSALLLLGASFRGFGRSNCLHEKSSRHIWTAELTFDRA